MRTAVWAEQVPYDRLCSKRVLGMLADRGVGLVVAVTPPLAHGFAGVVRAARAAGVRVGMWPMLGHAEGRWPSVANAAAFEGFVLPLLDALAGARALPEVLAVDLEPPIGELAGLLSLRPAAIAGGLRRGRRRGAAQRLRRIVKSAERRGLDTLAAAIPLVLADADPGGWQRFFGTPIDALGTARVSPMLYSSMIEGYARGRLSRGDVLGLLALGARETRRRFGERASVSLGAVAEGILGDEPCYRGPGELAEDVAVARAAGIESLMVFCFDGMLRREPAEAWLDALVATPAAARLPPLSARARLAAAAALGAGWALAGGADLARRLRRAATWRRPVW